MCKKALWKIWGEIERYFSHPYSSMLSYYTYIYQFFIFPFPFFLLLRAGKRPSIKQGMDVGLGGYSYWVVDMAWWDE